MKRIWALMACLLTLSPAFSAVRGEESTAPGLRAASWALEEMEAGRSLVQHVTFLVSGDAVRELAVQARGLGDRTAQLADGVTAALNALFLRLSASVNDFELSVGFGEGAVVSVGGVQSGEGVTLLCDVLPDYALILDADTLNGFIASLSVRDAALRPLLLAYAGAQTRRALEDAVRALLAQPGVLISENEGEPVTRVCLTAVQLGALYADALDLLAADEAFVRAAHGALASASQSLSAFRNAIRQAAQDERARLDSMAVDETLFRAVFDSRQAQVKLDVPGFSACLTVCCESGEAETGEYSFALALGDGSAGSDELMNLTAETTTDVHRLFFGTLHASASEDSEKVSARLGYSTRGRSVYLNVESTAQRSPFSLSCTLTPDLTAYGAAPDLLSVRLSAQAAAPVALPDISGRTPVSLSATDSQTRSRLIDNVRRSGLDGVVNRLMMYMPREASPLLSLLMNALQ